jgi:hypothetical protein
MDRYMELDSTESLEPSCQMLSCQLHVLHDLQYLHATKRHRMTRRGGRKKAGLVPSLPSEPGRDDTERFEPRTELRQAAMHCTMRCVRSKKSPRRRVGVRSMNGDPYV